MACGKHGAGLETDVEEKDVSHLLTIRRPYSVRIQVALNTVSNGKCLRLLKSTERRLLTSSILVPNLHCGVMC